VGRFRAAGRHLPYLPAADAHAPAAAAPRCRTAPRAPLPHHTVLRAELGLGSWLRRQRRRAGAAACLPAWARAAGGGRRLSVFAAWAGTKLQALLFIAFSLGHVRMSAATGGNMGVANVDDAGFFAAPWRRLLYRVAHSLLALCVLAWRRRQRISGAWLTTSDGGHLGEGSAFCTHFRALGALTPHFH